MKKQIKNIKAIQTSTIYHMFREVVSVMNYSLLKMLLLKSSLHRTMNTF